ncbi:MAG: heavy metal translocating P-type ATPase [Eubacteriales bacterium]|nr:heavy metal translocating P-type ATPase [Eubacteriales bacterium]
MPEKLKKRLIRIAIGAGIFAGALFVPAAWKWARLAVFLAAYFFLGWNVLLKAGKNIVRGKVFDENFLMALATVGAFALGEYPEGVAVMLFYQVGEWFEDFAVGRSRRSIAALMDIRPDRATVQRDGQNVTVPPEEVQVGEILVVDPGERVALDGVVTQGEALLDTAALTGESLPRTAVVGDEVYSGCIDLNARLHLRVTRLAEESTVAKILDMVENAAARKSHSEAFITRFARWYTPAVVIAAALLALIPSLITRQPAVWVQRALLFLVVSCPCALVISVPLSFFGGIGGASRAGVLIKGSNYLEALARADTIAFDKTGTLTRGEFSVSAIETKSGTAEVLLETAALAEHISNHPIALSLQKAYAKPVDEKRVSNAQEMAGLGICAQVDGRQVYAGNARLMESQGISPAPPEGVGTQVHVAADGVYLGSILIRDTPKADAAKAIRDLKALGVRRTVMLTGDAPLVAKAVADEVGIDEYHAGLMPLDKVERVENLLGETSQGKGTLAFVGDGINDAPVLSRADVGIAMGALGSDAAIEAADIVIMDDSPARIAVAVRIARKTQRIVRQNVTFALAVKLVVMVLGALGYADMWAAVFADVGVSVLAILNAMRAQRPDKKGKENA